VAILKNKKWKKPKMSVWAFKNNSQKKTKKAKK